jgi:hypothetical protein
MEVHIMLEGFRRFSDQALAEIGCLPNILMWRSSDRTGALVIKCARMGDYPTGKNGLDYLKRALDERRTAQGLIILMGAQGEIVSRAPVNEVVANIGGAPPLQGANGWGPYWWLTADFKLANQERPY